MKFVWIYVIGSGLMDVRIMAFIVSSLRIFSNFWSFGLIGNKFTKSYLFINIFHMRANPWQNLQDGNCGNE
jgi:hypothetical protein